MPAFFIKEFIDEKYGKISDDDFFHIVNSLRKRVGEELICFDRNNKYICKIIKIERNFLLVEILESKKIEERKNKINLFVGLINFLQFDKIVKYLSALEIDTLTPIITEYTQQNLKISENRKKRWQKIIYEESKQSYNFKFLRINRVLNFKESLKFKGCNIIFHPSGNEYDKIYNVENINLFIGPEGGFSDNEINLAKENNFYIMKLPFNTILRTELAVITTIGFIRGKYGI